MRQKAGLENKGVIRDAMWAGVMCAARVGQEWPLPVTSNETSTLLAFQVGPKLRQPDLCGTRFS